MTESITIERLDLVGFRAYLKRKSFNLRKKNMPLNLAVFARNGVGKSSLVDSLEYYFSNDGTLKRLGQQSSSTHAGLGAVRHVDAEEKSVETSVGVWFRQGKAKFGDPRPFSTPTTDAAKRILSSAKVPFVIRGYELRRFIDETKPVDRYKELVAWFEMDPLLTVQESMQKLKRKVNAMASDTTEYNERLRDLTDVTRDAISKWCEPSVLDWLNENVLAPLDKSLHLEVLSSTDPAFQELESREQVERKSAGLTTLKKLLVTVNDLYSPPTTPRGDSDGHVPSFERAVSTLEDAVANEDATRSATSESVFKDVWENARDLLGDEVELDKCPVCYTDFVSSPYESRNGVYVNLERNLLKLEEYRKAEKDKKDAEADLDQAVGDLGEVLDRFSLLADSAYSHNAVAAYREILRLWEAGEKAPCSKEATETLTRLRTSISTDIERIERRQGDRTYSNALETAPPLACCQDSSGTHRAHQRKNGNHPGRPKLADKGVWRCHLWKSRSRIWLTGFRMRWAPSTKISKVVIFRYRPYGSSLPRRTPPTSVARKSS